LRESQRPDGVRGTNSTMEHATKNGRTKKIWNQKKATDWGVCRLSGGTGAMWAGRGPGETIKDSSQEIFEKKSRRFTLIMTKDRSQKKIKEPTL